MGTSGKKTGVALEKRISAFWRHCEMITHTLDLMHLMSSSSPSPLSLWVSS